MDIVSINIPKDKVQVLITLLEIAEQPHKMNCSPVHIVEKLRAIDRGHIIELRTEFQKLN